MSSSSKSGKSSSSDAGIDSSKKMSSSSKSGKPSSSSDAGIDSLTDRFQEMATFPENNKPDFKEFDLGSPVSPLRTRRLVGGGLRGGGGGGGATTAAASGMTGTSSSSNSSGSITGKTGTNNPAAAVKRSDGSHSGELSGSSESSPTAAESVRSAPGNRNYRPGHARSHSGGVPLIYSGGSSANSSSPPVSPLPAGNICPSGKVLKTGMTCKSPARRDVLGSGTGNYGHGSIMRGHVKGKSDGGGSSRTSIGTDSTESSKIRLAMMSSDPEEVKRAGNEQYKRGHFAEALSFYDRAIKISPGNAACHSNRAAALTALGRLTEALRECEEAVRLDPGYGRAHQRLASLHLRLGHVENARTHLCFPGQQPDPAELQKLQTMERHLNRCANARKVGDWKSALREGDAAIAAGADSSPQLFACRTEALLKLHQLEDVDTSLAAIPKFEPYPNSCSQTKFFGILSESYVFLVRAQVEMAFGRFENAVADAEKAGQIDPRNVEVAVMLNNIRSVARARSLGNELFKSGKFVEACSAYGDGLKLDSSNSVLYCNRAVCWSKLGQWEKSVEDCNQALRIQPKYTKALLRRATSNAKLERWVESVRDYEVLRKQLPEDREIAEALFHAQVALKKSRGEEVQNLKFGGEVEEILDLDQFRAVISSPGVSIVLFKAASDQQCVLISPTVDTLCAQYPSLNFLKVDVNSSPAIAKAETVNIVPTFKIYKNGKRVKEMICPSSQILEQSVRHYSL